MILTSLALGFLAFAPQSVSQQEAWAKKISAVFATLDRYDPLDTSKLPFVKVTWPGSEHAKHGFLLGESKESKTIRCVDLSTLKAPTESRPASQESAARVEPEEITNYAKEASKRIANPKDANDRYYMKPNETMCPTAEALLLARACERRGLHDEAALLLSAIVDLDDALAMVMSGTALQLSMEIGDSTIPRTSLLEHHRSWLEIFPKSNLWRKPVERCAEILTRMVGEDEKRGASSRASSIPTKDELAARLIFDLRDQVDPPKYEEFANNGYYVSGFNTQESWDASTAGRLKQLGFDAVPRLIASLEDDTLTRCVWYTSRYGGGFLVVPISTFANSLLEQISGVAFQGKPNELKAQWTNWWQSIQSKGEESVTAEIVKRGDHTSASAAEKFLERWPKHVGDVIAGAKRAENRNVRQSLVSIIGKSDDPQAAAFLREELENGPYTVARVDAAKAMLAKGNKDGLRTILKAWRSGMAHREAHDPTAPATVADVDFSFALGEGRQYVYGFLISAGDLTALEAVAGSVPSLSPDDRRAVLEATRYHGFRDILERVPVADKAKFETTVEDMFAWLLDDNYREWGASVSGVSYRGKYGSIRNSRTSDLAAIALAEEWPDRYDFDPRGSVKARDAGILDVKNHWRRARGLPALSPPKPNHLRSNDPEIPRIVAHLAGSPSAEEIRADRSRLEVASLGALPWIEDKIAELPADHPARKELDALANRLANDVREVNVVADGWDLPAALSERAKKLKGARLESEAVVQLLMDFFAALPKELGSVAIRAERAGDGSGVLFRIVATPGESRGRNRVECWRSILADDRDLLGGGSAWGSDRGKKLDQFSDEIRAINEALATPRDSWFQISISMTAD